MITAFPVLIDWRPGYLDDTESSLLCMPLGTGTVLTHVRTCLAPPRAGEVSVLPLFEWGQPYEVRMRAELPALGVIAGPRQFAGLVDHFEPSDWLLLVDPAYFPAEGFRLAELTSAAPDPQVVTHLVMTERTSGCAPERVLLDAAGHVQRIQRYYRGVTWVDTCRVACSLMSAAVARAVADRPFSSLSDLRQTLAGRAIPSRDVLGRWNAVDLSTECGFLRLSDRFLLRRRVASASSVVPVSGQDVHISARCRVHPTARLYGPLLVQGGVTLDKHTTVIGPALLGAGCHIRHDSVVAHCVVGRRAIVPAGTTAAHRVLVSSANGHCPSRDRDRRGATPVEYEVGPELESPASAARADWYPTLKCVVDWLLAAVALIVLSPLFLAAAAAVKLTSRGPVLFVHLREGRAGRVFRCWKFRTMVQGAHSQQRALYQQNLVDGPQFKLQGDPRITRVGHIIRTTNIDELPQLINVLLGEMSLIGPRPSPFRENQICVPWRQARLSVRPGITGLWQICRTDRAAGDFHQWIYFDLLYVRHMSPGLDLKIVLATLATLGGRWSVPLSWLIPARKLHGDSRAPILPTRAPILGEVALLPAVPQAARTVS